MNTREDTITAPNLQNLSEAETGLNLSTVCIHCTTVLCQDIRWHYLSTRLRTVPVKVLK